MQLLYDETGLYKIIPTDIVSYKVRENLYKICIPVPLKREVFLWKNSKKFTETGVCKISVTDMKTKPHLHSWSFCAMKLLNETDVFPFLSLADMNHRCPLAKITIGNTLLKVAEHFFTSWVKWKKLCSTDWQTAHAFQSWVMIHHTGLWSTLDSL